MYLPISVYLFFCLCLSVYLSISMLVFIICLKVCVLLAGKSSLPLPLQVYPPLSVSYSVSLYIFYFHLISVFLYMYFVRFWELFVDVSIHHLYLFVFCSYTHLPVNILLFTYSNFSFDVLLSGMGKKWFSGAKRFLNLCRFNHFYLYIFYVNFPIIMFFTRLVSICL